jgi:hypothetical protein
LIWLPEGKNTLGHAALQTDKYYISLWPLRGKHFRCSESSITGCLHIHEHSDWVEEGSSGNLRGPTSRYEIANVTNEAINHVYEELLCYNKINPKEVTLEAAERKSFGLRRIELPETRYSLIGCVIVDKRIEKRYSDLLYFCQRCLASGWGNIDICRQCIRKATTYKLTRVNCPFYHKPQSCVSMCFNLIEMADPSPLVCLVEARNNTKKFLSSLSVDDICLQITVPNFEKNVVQKYWIEGSGQRVHYDSKDFQKRTRFLRTSENIFKEMFSTGPTISIMAWLRNGLNYSFLSLFGLCLIIQLIYFLFSFFVQVKLFPSVRLPKSLVYAVGFPCFAAYVILISCYIGYSVYTTIIEACQIGTIEDCNLQDKAFFCFLITIMIFNFSIQYCGYFFFVKISEFIFRFIVDASLKRQVYHSG